MPDTRYLVVDANVLVDLALELAGTPRQPGQCLKAFVTTVRQPMLEIDGELAHVRVVLSKHIMEQARKALVQEGRAPEDAVRLAIQAARIVLGPDGVYDETDEDYKELSRRAWARLGTDAEDEAVLRCAEAHDAAILTRDRDFASYLDDRKVAHWSLNEFLNSVRIIHR